MSEEFNVIPARSFSNVPASPRGDHSNNIRPFLFCSNTNEPFFKQRKTGGIIFMDNIVFSPKIAYCGCDRNGPFGGPPPYDPPFDENERFRIDGSTFVSDSDVITT